MSPAGMKQHHPQSFVSAPHRDQGHFRQHHTGCQLLFSPPRAAVITQQKPLTVTSRSVNAISVHAPRYDKCIMDTLLLKKYKHSQLIFNPLPQRKEKNIQSQTMKYFVQRPCAVITPHLA